MCDYPKIVGRLHTWRYTNIALNQIFVWPRTGRIVAHCFTNVAEAKFVSVEEMTVEVVYRLIPEEVALSLSLSLDPLVDVWDALQSYNYQNCDSFPSD